MKKQYNDWKVLRKLPKQKLLCECKCGLIKEHHEPNITSGKSKMCRKCRDNLRIGSGNRNWKGNGVVPGRYFSQLKYKRKHLTKGRTKRHDIKITISDIDNLFTKQNGLCALSGVPISFKYNEKTASLDRIDSNKGYTIDNIQLVHKIVNKMKTDINQEIFLQYCYLIGEYVKSKK